MERCRHCGRARSEAVPARPALMGAFWALWWLLSTSSVYAAVPLPHRYTPPASERILYTRPPAGATMLAARVLSDGGVCVAGFVQQEHRQLFIAKAAESGLLEWSCAGGLPGDNQFRDVYVDAEGAIYAAGHISNAGGEAAGGVSVPEADGGATSTRAVLVRLTEHGRIVALDQQPAEKGNSTIASLAAGTSQLYAVENQLSGDNQSVGGSGRVVTYSYSLKVVRSGPIRPEKDTSAALSLADISTDGSSEVYVFGTESGALAFLSRYSTAERREIWRATFEGDSGAPTTALVSALDPNGFSLVACAARSTLHVWKLNTRGVFLWHQSLEARTDVRASLAFGSDWRAYMFLAAREDRTPYSASITLPGGMQALQQQVLDAKYTAGALSAADGRMVFVRQPEENGSMLSWVNMKPYHVLTAELSTVHTLLEVVVRRVDGVEWDEDGAQLLADLVADAFRLRRPHVSVIRSGDCVTLGAHVETERASVVAVTVAAYVNTDAHLAQLLRTDVTLDSMHSRVVRGEGALGVERIRGLLIVTVKVVSTLVVLTTVALVGLLLTRWYRRRNKMQAVASWLNHTHRLIPRSSNAAAPMNVLASDLSSVHSEDFDDD